VKNSRRKGQLVRLIQTYGLDCVWCGKKCDPSAPEGHPDFPTREHLVPRWQGGVNAFSNLRLACYACNQKRGPGTKGNWTPLKPVNQRRHKTPDEIKKRTEKIKARQVEKYGGKPWTFADLIPD